MYWSLQKKQLKQKCVYNVNESEKSSLSSYILLEKNLRDHFREKKKIIIILAFVNLWLLIVVNCADKLLLVILIINLKS